MPIDGVKRTEVIFTDMRNRISGNTMLLIIVIRTRYMTARFATKYYTQKAEHTHTHAKPQQMIKRSEPPSINKPTQICVCKRQCIVISLSHSAFVCCYTSILFVRVFLLYFPFIPMRIGEPNTRN